MHRHRAAAVLVALVAVGTSPASHAASGYGSQAAWSDGGTAAGPAIRQTKITESGCRYLNGTTSTSATQDVSCRFTAVADTQVGHVQQGECRHTDASDRGSRTVGSANCSATVTVEFGYTCARAAGSCHGTSDDPVGAVAFSGVFQYTSPDGVNAFLGTNELRATMKNNRVTVTGAAVDAAVIQTFLSKVSMTFPCTCKPSSATASSRYGGFAGNLTFAQIYGVQ